jgi:DNA-binding response OmpR family regulator
MRILAGGEAVQASPLEYRLIAYLMHHKGRVVSPHELIEHLYGDDDARNANALEALIMRLRKKLGADAIETRRGFGYKIADAPA